MKPDQLLCMARFSKKGLGTLPYLRWSSLQQLIMVGLIINGQQYLHVAVVTQPSLQAKIKSDENGHALKAAFDTISCFVDMILHFFENTDYFHNYYYFLTNIPFHFKNELQK